MLEVRFLGQFDVRRDGALLVIPTRSAQSLFAYLLLTGGTAHRREKLAGVLWPDSTEENARKYLRTELWRLRKAIESRGTAKEQARYLQVDEISVGLDAHAQYWLDVEEIGRRTPGERSLTELAEMLSVYTGPLLPDLYDDWVILERDRLRASFDEKMDLLLERYLQAERWGDAVEWAERWIALGQAPEPAYRSLMLAHRAVGNVSRVGSVFGRYVQAMRADLGLAPSSEMQALYERLTHPEAGSAEPLSRTAPNRALGWDRPRASLPVPLTSFVGRERDAARIRQSFSNTRLLTLVGPGGIGKTRLAIRVAADMSSQFAGGVSWCDLASVESSERVPLVIADVLGISPSSQVPMIETIAHAIGSQSLFLVLDNCEHLLEACADLGEHLLRACPSLKIMATSREALKVSSEALWPVSPLSLPEPDRPCGADEIERYESVRLFVERARGVDPDFAITEENASLLVQICRRLDGMPLAIELAAARVSVLSLADIQSRLNDRFDLLIARHRGAGSRHQTLRAVLDWSHDLLGEPEKTLFRRLSVFAGGWTLDAAEALCGDDLLDRGDVLEYLSRLVDKSLVVVTREESKVRYHLLETVREYALGKLEEAGEKERLKRLHMAWFAALAARAEVGLRGPRQIDWLDLLQSEHDNLNEAWGWAIECEPRHAVSLTSAMLSFWLMRGNSSEGHAWAESLLAKVREGELADERAIVFALAARGNYLLDELAPARSRLEEALILAQSARDKPEIAYVRLWLGSVAFHQGDLADAKKSIEAALAFFEELEDPWGTARANYLLGNIHDVEGNQSAAQSLYRVSWTGFQRLGDEFSLGFVANALGELARQREDYASAGRFYEESIEIFRRLKSRAALESPTQNLAWVCLQQGNYQEARALFEETLRVFQQQGNQNSTAYTLTGFIGLAAAAGQAERAAQLLGAMETWFEEFGNGRPIEQQDRKELDRYLAMALEQLEQSAFDAAYSEGRLMNLERAVALALEQ